MNLVPSEPAAALARTSRKPSSPIGALIVGAIAFGVAAGHWFPPGPNVLVLGALVAGVTLLISALVFKGRLLDTLGGFKFTAVLLFVLSVASAIGTLILQGKPEAFYVERYGAAAKVVTLLRLDDVFHSLWFAELLALFIAGLTVALLRRWPINSKNAGFFACHLGLLLSLLGAALSTTMSLRGRVDLNVGRTVSEATLKDGRRAPLGFDLRLDKFDVDRYATEHRIAFWEPSAKARGDYALKASFDPVAGNRHRLPNGASFTIKGYYPDVVVNEQVVEVMSGGQPALRVMLDGRERWLLAGERVMSTDGQTAVLFGWKTPEPPAGQKVPQHMISAGAGSAPRPIALGGSLSLDDGSVVKALRYLPHFTYDIETKTAVSVDDTPANPALEVAVTKDGVEKKRWLFAKMPGYNHDNTAIALTYSLGETVSGGVRAVLVAADDRSVVLSTPEGRTSVPFADGMGAFDGAVTLTKMMAHAERKREFSTASNESHNPTAVVEVNSGGQVREAVLSLGRGRAEAANGVLVLERRGEEVKAWRSTVTAMKGGTQETAELAVNTPFSFGGWMFYQANHNPKDPTYSGLDVVKDPGVELVFAGFGLISLGVIYMLYIQPQLRRRREA